MTIYKTIEDLGITIPAMAAPSAAFVPFVFAGNLLHLSGHIAKRDGKPWVAQLGRDMTTSEGKLAARSVAIDLLGTLEAATQDLGRIKRIVKLLVLVNSASDFTEPHVVANGASELLIQLFGDRGPHARSAFGAAQLPFGTCVEIEMIAEV